MFLFGLQTFAGDRMSKNAQRCTDFPLEISQHLSGHFDLLGSMFRPFVGSSLQTVVAVCDIGGSGGREAGAGKPFFQLALGFSEFAKHDFLGGHPAKLFGQTDLGQRPNDPLGGVDLPWLYPVAVVVLKFVVIVMVPFA